MPRIRKKTSKRGTTARRTRIKRKVVESRKKSKKAAKKDVTWKSKKSKDPGIPNNFPYKDQILAEIAEERRQAAEAKARQKEEKKALRAQQKVALKANGKDGGDDGSGGEDNDDVEGENGDFDGVATLRGPLKNTSSKSMKNGAHPVASGTPTAASALTADASCARLLLNSDLPHLSAVLDKADVVIEVLDARDPLAYRSSALEARVASKEGQKLLVVLNKIDTCPRETTAAWAAHLRSEHPTLLFRVASAFLPPAITHDATKGKVKGKEPPDDAWGLNAVSTLLGLWAQEKTGDGPLHVAVVGLTNSGKSAFINSLARKATLDVYAISSFTNGPSTTLQALEVTLELDGRPVVFIDTPGITWEPSEESPEESEGRRAQDVLLRNRGRIDRLKDPMSAVSCILSRAQTEDLMVFYGLPAFVKGDVDAFLVGVARAHGLIKKRGDPDLAVAARIVLRDWSTGKLSRYAILPPTSETGTVPETVSPTLGTIYAGDAELLEKLTPRKELRQSRDLVRLSSSRVDDRLLMLEASWLGADDANGESNSDEDDEDELHGMAEAEAIGSGTDEEAANWAGQVIDSESDGHDEDEELPNMRSSSAGKKRKRSPLRVAPPKPQLKSAKHVTFAASVMTVTPSTRPRSPLSKSKSKLKSGRAGAAFGLSK
ncbi:P-loop containing nucleoside triphosphate hydrolase protein [Russula dissimulans]|nr:P-loop containing nucleoside triphosphate hydrolase protein [Russula dissimulans]